ncbi:hypothetical protein ACLOJK_025739 [Asimina triloba]
MGWPSFRGGTDAAADRCSPAIVEEETLSEIEEVPTSTAVATEYGSLIGDGASLEQMMEMGCGHDGSIIMPSWPILSMTWIVHSLLAGGGFLLGLSVVVVAIDEEDDGIEIISSFGRWQPWLPPLRKTMEHRNLYSGGALNMLHMRRILCNLVLQ